jgi:hypothetical protein
MDFIMCFIKLPISIIIIIFKKAIIILSKTKLYKNTAFNIKLINVIKELKTKIYFDELTLDSPKLKDITYEINKMLNAKYKYDDNFILYKINKLIDENIIFCDTEIILGKKNETYYHIKKYPVKYKIFNKINAFLKYLKLLE